MNYAGTNDNGDSSSTRLARDRANTLRNEANTLLADFFYGVNYPSDIGVEDLTFDQAITKTLKHNLINHHLPGSRDLNPAQASKLLSDILKD